MKNITLSPATAELPALTLVTVDVPCAQPGNFFQNATRRAKLVRVLRAAFVAWSASAEAHTDLFAGLTSPDPAELAAVTARCKHFLRRYEALEAVLAEESGLSRSSVYNSVASQWPLCSRLLRAGL